MRKKSEIQKLIYRAGVYAGGVRGKTEIRKVNCQGCGKEIQSEGLLEDIQYVKTKRGTELFFHSACMNSIWKHGIV